MIKENLIKENVTKPQRAIKEGNRAEAVTLFLKTNQSTSLHRKYMIILFQIVMK